MGTSTAHWSSIILTLVTTSCASLSSRPSTPLLDRELRACNQPAIDYGCGTLTYSRGVLQSIQSEVDPVPGLPVIALYAFEDGRKDWEPNRLGTEEFRQYPRRQRPPQPTYSDEPVATTIGRFFVVALLSRGFRVIDLRQTAYGSGRPAGDARAAVTGTIEEFWQTTCWDSAQGRGCGIQATVAVRVRLHSIESGQIVWEQRYSRSCAISDTSSLCNWTRVVREVAVIAVKDSELLEQVNRQ
jgi:hypothetical protein